MLLLRPVLGFLNHPLMLGWLAAAAVPLIIHLLSRKKYREVPWAAMQYLLAAMRKNSRRIRIEQWILLAIRTLLIMLLVLAVAEPFLESAGVKLGSGDRTHKVLVLDGSFSMAYKPSDKSRFDRAKELATRIVDESSQGDGFTLVLMSSPPRVVVGTPAFEPRQFRQEIDNLRLPHGGGDLPGTLAKVEELLVAARRDQPRMAREEIYFLTDLGRTSWAPELRGGAVEDFRARSQRLDRAAELFVIDLGQSDSDNTAVTQFTPAEPFITVAGGSTLEAEIRNFGRQSRTHQLVELYADGRRVGQEFVDLEPGGRSNVTFPYRFETAGNHAVELRMAPDLLDIDNHRWLSVNVKDQLRVLCIDGRPGGAASDTAGTYLKRAAAEPQGIEIVRADVVSESALLEADLNTYDCVVLANVAQFTSSEAAVLASYLKRGGGVIFFLGDQVQADNYNRRLTGNSTEGVHVLPATLASQAARGVYTFNPLGYQHPILAPFRGVGEASLLNTPTLEYVKLLLPEDSKSRVVLAFDSGDPAIVEEPIGRGRSILVATSADASWTTMPALGSYVPIVRELWSWSVRGQLAEHNMLVGQPLADSVRNLADRGNIKIRSPGGETTAVRLSTDGEYGNWSYGDTSTSGIYGATASSAVAGGEELFAVNVDTAESDLTKIEPSELHERTWPGISFTSLVDWQDLSHNSSDAIVKRNTLHQFVLIAALVLLFLETLLAYRFGRRAV